MSELAIVKPSFKQHPASVVTTQHQSVGPLHTNGAAVELKTGISSMELVLESPCIRRARSLCSVTMASPSASSIHLCTMPRIGFRPLFDDSSTKWVSIQEHGPANAVLHCTAL